MQHKASLFVTLCIIVSLSACGGSRVKDGPGVSRVPNQRDAVPRPEPRSKYGNGPVYEVFGKRYRIMPSSTGYKERGVASWYGKKFHGNLTSNREVYDMYSMTAAHKTLPLPAYVRVRNLLNNKTIVVRVNDRGPFVHNRIIDLSYAAAQKLDMIRDGTALVEVTAISFESPPPTPSTDRTVSVRRPAEPPAEARPTAAPAASRIFVQVGAFGDQSNAERRIAALSRAGITNSFIHEEGSSPNTLYKVRIGPVGGVVQYDALVQELELAGIVDPYLISE